VRFIPFAEIIFDISISNMVTREDGVRLDSSECRDFIEFWDCAALGLL